MKPFYFLLFLLLGTTLASAQTSFIHPGGLHTQTDLDRMKTNVAAGAHPWIDDWNVLITDAQAQNTYKAAPNANMGANRQRADADAHAAYLNALRWYISGDTTYANCAVRICNAWSSTVNQVPTGNNIPGLSGIPIFDFALAAEVLRIYSGWSSSDFTRFKNMMETYLYPVCHDFLTNHNGACISSYWANWDICNIGSLIAMGVLCDDTAKYNEGVSYFKNGAGNGSIGNAVYYLYSSTLGQWQESGRDQEHAQLGVGMTAYLCQVAWNQGLDLFGYNSNRLLAGAEYVAQTNLWNTVPYTFYTNCQNARQDWVSINGRGRLDDRPIWELLYNHYVVQQGLSAPHVQAMAQLMRPEHGSTDHFGYGTLTFTRSATSSPYPPSPTPAAPTGVSATAGVGRVTLNWTLPSGNTVQGYNVQRSTTSGGPYTSIASWTANTTPQYTDATVTNGTTYYYVLAAINQSGTGSNSTQVSATPLVTGALPSAWSRQDIGTVSAAGSASYANVSGGTFLVSGSGNGIGGTADGLSYAYESVTGDATITARIWSISGTLSRTGVMIRETLDPGASTLVMKVGDVGWREAGFGTRSTTGGSMTWIGGNDYTVLPAWFRLQRAGNTFTAYESSDGLTWFTVGTSTVSMANAYYIGLAASSGSTTGALDATTFDNVTITSGPVANGTYRLVNRNSGKVMDVYGQGTANGTNVDQYTWNGGTNQQWKVSDLGNGEYSIFGVQSGKSLDITGNSTADGANVEIWTSNGGANQQFSFTMTDSGYFRITPLNSGKAVEVAGNSTANGGNVDQWTYNGGNNQQWKLVDATAAATAAEATAHIGRGLMLDSLATASGNGVIIYPNPVTDLLTVKLGADLEKGVIITLYDVNGHVMSRSAVKSAEYQLPFAKLPSGIYFIQVSKDAQSITRKIIKK
ncbi:RICIN domain-containing protein [Puia dinghuensis]|uniref:Fibronectin type-III domain-containing protein n=1 Tax=Puia dinghuensis TaxID=1792502 RepID=A0A8J2UCE6_9BACT|nr:RICIN domain-containing protein [Puia dinghuensis]GGA98307.1 hypothetical protein GCM10011511_22020 [Puia dinghuensis]